MLSRAQVEAIQTLSRHWHDEAVVLIGAGALGLFLEMSWRATADIDLTVTADVPRLDSLEQVLEGWRRDRHQEQRFHGPAGVQVDVIPASEQLREAGYVEWPSGFRMSLVGMRLAFDEPVHLQLSPEFSLSVAPPEVIAVLKVIAYLDRPRHRITDLVDVAYILEERVGEGDEERYSEEIIERGLTYEEAGPFVIGRRIGAIVNRQERERLEAFLANGLDPDDAAGVRQRLLDRGPTRWRMGDDQVRRRLAAFGEGLSS